MESNLYSLTYKYYTSVKNKSKSFFNWFVGNSDLPKRHSCSRTDPCIFCHRVWV